jgi:CubicO group peptidase (beta-lactamase class C family)
MNLDQMKPEKRRTSMDPCHSDTNDRRLAGRRMSRRKAIGFGGAGLAASALATVGLPRSGSAQDANATPVAGASASGISAERVEAASAGIDTIVADFLARSGVPGLAIAAVYQDEIVHLAGYGEREAGASETVDPDTVFQLASLSKPVASTIISALVGDGVVTWDTRISDLDASFAMHDAWVTREVTLRDMFAHRSGLPHHAGDDLEDLGYDREAVLHRLRYLQPASSFRSTYAYTNFGLTVAAVAAADAAGATWEDLAAARLFQPLGMTSTSSRFDDFMSATNRAHGHVLLDGAYVAKYQRQPDAQSPAGGVSSTARDLCQWLRLQLGGGTVDGQEIIDTEALGETHRPQIVSQSPEHPATDRASFYGLGWGVSYDGQARVRLSHSGAFGLGAGTAAYLIPAAQIGVVVLTNAAPIGLAEAIALSFLDLAEHGAVAFDYFEILGPLITAEMAPAYGVGKDYAAPPADPEPPLALESYVGDFENDYFGKATVNAEGDEMVLRLGPDQAAYPLRHYDRDIFLYQPVGENAGGESAVMFSVDADGQAMSVTVENLDVNHQGMFTRIVLAD